MKGEQANHTWQPTGLVNLELLKVKALRASDSDAEAERRAFLGLAGHMMRRLLIHHSRPLAKRVERSELVDMPTRASPARKYWLKMEQALDRLATIYPNRRSVVELRVFEGPTGKECAERMGVSTATVSRYWEFARQWLEDEFGRPVAP